MIEQPQLLGPFWGLLGPEKLISTRRSRTLGLGPTNRLYNDLAVPGMGGVFFGKQLCQAVLGIAVAQALRESGKNTRNIETANAVEALACRLAYEKNGWTPDRRMRGISKLTGNKELPTFEQARRPSHYVTQPLRMATVQPLLALGLTTGRSERFNGYALSDRGQDLVEILCEEYSRLYYSQNFLDLLIAWALGKSVPLNSLATALSPNKTLPRSVRELIFGFLSSDPRRKQALAWVKRCAEQGKAPSSAKRPAEITQEHWSDIESGALFFATQDAAIKVLLDVEKLVRQRESHFISLDEKLPKALLKSIGKLVEHADRFLSSAHDPSPTQEARRFCGECKQVDKVLAHLVRRDDRVLRLNETGSAIVPGPAFATASEFDSLEETGAGDESERPQSSGILDVGDLTNRIRNLMLLSVDLEGKLTRFLENAE